MMVLEALGCVFKKKLIEISRTLHVRSEVNLYVRNNFNISNHDTIFFERLLSLRVVHYTGYSKNSQHFLQSCIYVDRNHFC